MIQKIFWFAWSHRYCHQKPYKVLGAIIWIITISFDNWVNLTFSKPPIYNSNIDSVNLEEKGAADEEFI